MRTTYFPGNALEVSAVMILKFFFATFVVLKKRKSDQWKQYEVFNLLKYVSAEVTFIFDLVVTNCYFKFNFQTLL